MIFNKSHKLENWNKYKKLTNICILQAEIMKKNDFPGKERENVGHAKTLPLWDYAIHGYFVS